MPKVAITYNHNIAAAIEEALSLLELKKLIANKIVAIKPNETWASPEDTTAVTQPDTLRAVLRHVKKFKPRALIVSGGSGDGETNEIFKIAGLMDVVKEEGAEFFDHNRPPFMTVPLSYARDKGVDGPQKEVVINPKVLTYETLISLAQLKVHETATVTLYLKNIAMSYPAADHYGHPRSAGIHPHHFFEDMHSFIAGMAKRFPIQLGIIAGHPAMIGRGPIGGQTLETGLVIASPDALACDTIGAKLLGFNPEGVGHIKKAGILGVGETNMEKMEIVGTPFDAAGKVFARAVYGKEIDLA